MTKPLHCGNSARNGVMAALLAGKGFTSHAAVFEGNNGYFGSFGRSLPTDYAPFPDLGSRWELRHRLQYQELSERRARPYCDRGGADLARKIGGGSRDITNIHCWMSPASAKRINTDYPPDVEAANSLPPTCSPIGWSTARPRSRRSRSRAQGSAHARDAEACHCRSRSQPQRCVGGESCAAERSL